jgi:hypothetical protein
MRCSSLYSTLIIFLIVADAALAGTRCPDGEDLAWLNGEPRFTLVLFLLSLLMAVLGL